MSAPVARLPLYDKGLFWGSPATTGSLGDVLWVLGLGLAPVGVSTGGVGGGGGVLTMIFHHYHTNG